MAPRPVKSTGRALSSRPVDVRQRRGRGDLAKRLSNAGNAFAAISEVDNVLVLEGGIPIIYREEVIGAIGISGAPGGQYDAACAQKALGQNKALSGGGNRNG